MKDKAEFPDLTLSDRILKERSEGKEIGKVVNVPATVWTFPNDLPLIGKLIRTDQVTVRQAKQEGIEADGEAKRKFPIYVFEHLETKTYHSLAGASLDRSGLEVGHYYIVDPPIRKEFTPANGGAKRQFKDFGVIDITEQVLAELDK